MSNRRTTKKNQTILAGLLFGLISLALITGAAGAEQIPQPLAQGTAAPQASATPAPTESIPPKECVDCHPDKKDAWMDSPHAHAADDPVFLEGWENMERSTECLLCHEATYQQDTGEYLAEGVACETCHGTAGADHPLAQVPARSDEEYCGTCHPTTLGEVRLSGHSTVNEVRCVDCHDPHSQKVLFKNPDDMCKGCHDEDLSKMDEALGKIHLQEGIPCADCHTLDVPHTFLFNFQHEDTTPFFKGFDCTSEITASVASRAGTSHEALGSYVNDQMNWPIVHRVSRVESASQCSDCHVMDDKLRTDFAALGYSSEELDQLSWESEDFPALTEAELNELVAKPRRSWSWVYWLMGVAGIFGVFEITVARKLDDSPRISWKVSLASTFRRRSIGNEKKNKDEQDGEE